MNDALSDREETGQAGDAPAGRDLRWLICTHHLHEWAGSEVVTVELSEALAARGHEVTLFSPFADAPFLDEAGLTARPCLRDAGAVRLEDYDVVYAHHQIPARFLARQTPETLTGAQRPVFVYNHLSPFEPFEFPGPFTEAALADIILVNSPETAQKLASFGPAFEQTTLFPNPAPRAFACPPATPVPTWLTRVLSVTNHMPDELAHALRILEGQGVQVTRVGLSAETRRITPADIQSHDAVVSIGKTVQYAFRAQRPVFCYDHFGGPGWLLPDRVQPAAAANFSGRCSPGARDAEILARELARGFTQAQQNMPDPGPYLLEDHLDRLESRIAGIRARPDAQRAPRGIEALGGMNGFLAQCRHEEAIYALVDRQYGHQRGFQARAKAQGLRLRHLEETLGIRPRSRAGS